MEKNNIIKIFKTSKNEIFVFKGNKGDSLNNKKVDILVKYKNNNFFRTPKHIHWVVDIIIKKTHNKKLTSELVEEFKKIYDLNDNFKSIRDMKACNIVLPRKDRIEKFKTLNKYGCYSVDFLLILVALFSKMEKNCEKHYRFKNLLFSIIEKDEFAVINEAIRR